MGRMTGSERVYVLVHILGWEYSAIRVPKNRTGGPMPLCFILDPRAHDYESIGLPRSMFVN